MFSDWLTGADADRVYRFAETGQNFLNTPYSVLSIHLFKRSLKTWNGVPVTFVRSFSLLLSSCHPSKVCTQPVPYKKCFNTFSLSSWPS